jgi:hypothetical protein
VSFLHNSRLPDPLIRHIWTIPAHGLPLSARYARICVLLAHGSRLSELEGDVRDLETEVSDLGALVDALTVDARPLGAQIEDLLILNDIRTGDENFKADISDSLRACIRSRQSDLSDGRRWGQLGFMDGLLEMVSRD